MPPDSSPGSWSSVPASSTCSRTWRVMAAISAGAWRPCSRRRKPTFSATVSEARSAEDWKTMAMRKGFSSGGRARYSPSSIPPTVMRPASGRSRPTICRSSTDFPVPLWPTMASSSPGATRRSTPASTTCSPYAFRTPASSTETPCRRSAAGLAILGGCRSNHGGCGERSGGCERRARSSLLRRAYRHASSVVAALAALAPRLVRLAHHGYSDRLLDPGAMTLRSKLTLMFFGALQVTFLTAVGTFWAVQSWQLLTDDLTLIHEQNVRLEHVLDGGTAPQRAAFLRALRHHAQTLEEIELIDRLAAADGEAVASANAAQPLQKHYHAQVGRLRERARFVTRLSSGLLVAVVGLVLAGLMAYFAALPA